MDQLGEGFSDGSVWPPMFFACYCRHLQLCLLSKEGLALCVSDLIKPLGGVHPQSHMGLADATPKVSTTEGAKQGCPGGN